MSRHPLAASALLTLALVAGEPASAADPAADPTHLAAAARLSDDTGGTARLTKVLDAMRGLMIRILTSHGKDADGAARLVDELLLPAMRSHLPELHAAFARFWADAMTTEQLDTADAFFRSPTGRRMIEVETEQMPALLAIGQEWGRRVGQEVLASQRDALRQHGVSL